MESTTEVSDGIPPGLSTCLTWFFIYSFCIQANTVLIQERQFVLSLSVLRSRTQTQYRSADQRTSNNGTPDRKRDNVIVHNQQTFVFPMKLYHQKLQVRQEHKELATPNSHRHDNLYIFKIYTVFLSFLGSLIIFNYAKLLTKLLWRVKPEYHCFNCLSGPVFQNLPTKGSKHRKVATYGTNQAEGVWEVHWTFSPPRVRPGLEQSRLRVQLGDINEKNTSRSPPSCPHTVPGPAVPSGAGTGSQSVAHCWSSELIRWRERERWTWPRSVWGSSFTVVQ